MDKIITTWQQELSEGYSNAHEIIEHLNIPNATKNSINSADFPLRVPRGFVDRMEKGNLNDPLLKQILPIADENYDYAGFSNDPVGDVDAMKQVGVIHKYKDRVLLITTGSCAINCRYCFRRNFPYSDFQLSSQRLLAAIKCIQDDKAISEVILSGGDPLLLNDTKLFDLIDQLDEIKHLKRIRIHTRIPVVLPSRVTTFFCNRLAAINKTVVFVIHVNHSNELSVDVNKICKKITDCSITLLNQSVLLKGVNDNARQLCALSEKLFAFGVMPYYLHLLDKARGTGHFMVDEKMAIELMDQIKKQLPGYLVPKLVKEQAGADNKIVIA